MKLFVTLRWCILTVYFTTSWTDRFDHAITITTQIYVWEVNRLDSRGIESIHPLVEPHNHIGRKPHSRVGTTTLTMNPYNSPIPLVPCIHWTTTLTSVCVVHIINLVRSAICNRPACYPHGSTGYWTVVGVHSQGGCPNSAVRFTPDMIMRFYQRMNALNSVTIQSVHFPHVYLRCDGNGVVKPVGPGGGKVNCQYTPPKSYEQFHIYPIAMKPSIAPLSTFPVLILSATWNNVYIRMDGSGMTKPNGGGGGTVNCQYGGRTYERFYYRQEKNKTFSFRSMKFPHCYLRLDGTGVTTHTGPGGGTVNCQYYEDPEKPLPDNVWETFYIS